jgi:hypothetical protein
VSARKRSRLENGEKKKEKKNAQLLDSPGANARSTASISGGISSVGTGASGSSAPGLKPGALLAPAAPPESRPQMPIPAPIARRPAEKDDERRCRGAPCPPAPASPPNPKPNPRPPPTPAACKLRLPPPRAGRNRALRRAPSDGVAAPARGERTARPASAAYA